VCFFLKPADDSRAQKVAKLTAPQHSSSEIVSKTDASPEVRKVYYELFMDSTDKIIQNVDLGVGGITGRLSAKQVIDEECVTKINRHGLRDKDKRGRELITYLLHENDVDRYEGFLNVWATADADNIRTEIHEALISLGLKVPERWARR
jgi:hypothetical protein